MGGRVRKGIVKNCHPLQCANLSMLLVQNCLRYVNIMTFESILCFFFLFFFCSRQVCLKELKTKFILPNLKHGAQRFHSEACSLKKCTLP